MSRRNVRMEVCEVRQKRDVAAALLIKLKEAEDTMLRYVWM